jgi:hypothetical protein
VSIVDRGRLASPITNTLHTNSEASNILVGTFNEPVTIGSPMGDYVPHITVDASLRFCAVNNYGKTKFRPSRMEHLNAIAAD